MASANINLCLVGYGFTAKTLHIPLIVNVPGLNLHSIVQRHPSPGNDAGADHPGAKVYDNVDSALADGDVHVVVVLTGNQTHGELARKALEAGKHVLVEKPFTVSSPEAYSLIDLAISKSLILTVYHNRRLDSDFLTLRDLLSNPSSPLGPVHDIFSTFNRYKPPAKPGAANPKPWKSARLPGNGLSWDLGIHLVDQALQLFGPPDRVWGFARDRLPGADRKDGARWGDEGFQDDWFVGGLEYNPGRPGWAAAGGTFRIECGCLKQGLPVRFEVQGELGSYIKHGFDGQERDLRKGISPRAEVFNAEADEEVGEVVLPGHREKVKQVNGWGYIRMYENLRDAITKGEKLLVDPKEAAEAVRIIELMGQSAKEGKVISL